jgi:hypothetical protein
MRLERIPCGSSWIVFGMATVLTVGCASEGERVTASRASIPAMVEMYSRFAQDHQGKGPTSEQEFREYVNGQTEKLELMDISADDVFTSPRTGGAFTWVYDGKTPVGPGGMKVLGYETVPTDGKRLIVGSRGMRDEIDEAEFRKLFPNAP